MKNTIVRQFEFPDGDHGIIVYDPEHPLWKDDFDREGPTKPIYILYKAGHFLCKYNSLEQIDTYLEIRDESI